MLIGSKRFVDYANSNEKVFCMVVFVTMVQKRKKTAVKRVAGF